MAYVNRNETIAKGASKAVKEYLNRLITVANKASKENTCVKTIYNRIESGKYKSCLINGVLFVVEDNITK